MSIGQKGMILAARTMYRTGLRLLKDKKLLNRVQEEFQESTEEQAYRPVISEKRVFQQEFH